MHGIVQAPVCVNGAVTIFPRKGSPFIAILNQVLYDPDPPQTESLLQPHRPRAHGVHIYETPTSRLGVDA